MPCLLSMYKFKTIIILLLCFSPSVFADSWPRRLSENRESTAEKPFWPDSPFIFVKEGNYSPQMNEKPDSKGLSLATTSTLGQPPSFNLLTASRNQLPATLKITIDKDPVYRTKKQYLAYPLTDIIKSLAKESTKPLINNILVFTAIDGYKVTMSYQDALLEKGYIAFKDLSAKNGSWVEFKFGNENTTPAPYYLLWTNPELDKWRYPSPFQLNSISLQTADNYFSAAAPVSRTPEVKQGFSLFSRYCIRCHSINHTGGKLGPELNLPKNITDYYTVHKLTAFILNAPSFRPETKMPIFKNVLSNDDALAIQHYLKAMKFTEQE